MNEEDSSVERLKKSLYVRNKVPKLKERRELHDEEHEVAHKWVHEDEIRRQEELLNNPDKILEELHKGHVIENDDEDFSLLRKDRYAEEERKKQQKNPAMASRIIKGVFIASLIFFVFAAGLAVFFLMGGKNQVSCDNVSVRISGPKSIASGKKLSLDVVLENNNPVPMLNTNLEVIFPEGSRNAENSAMSISSTKELVGSINSGEQVRSSARALLFGQEQTQTEIKTVVTYSIDDSNASFTCETPYQILIATAPVSLTVRGLEEISSGQELELEVLVTSNSDEIVPDLRLVVEYPYGFEFVSAEPSPVADDRVWNLGDVSPGMERTIKIRGVVKGQGTEARSIGLSVGDADPANEKGIQNVLQKIEHPLLITRPFLELSFKVNGEQNSQTVATLGEVIDGVLHWKNTLSSPLHGVEIDAIFNGIMLDPASVAVSNGFFRSVDKTIIWTPQTNENFEVIEPGEEGDLPFKFSTRHFEKGTSVSNPAMNIEFAVRARRTGDTVPVPQNLVGQAKKTIMFDTEVLFNTYAVYGVGPFTNTGPHPPKVDTETTYTVMLSVENNLNDMDAVEIRGELPVNVQWLNAVSPDGESLVFNPVTREVVWSVGEVPRGTGSRTDARVAYFQVATTPSISQLHNEIILFNKPRLQGIDGFTKSVLKREVLWVESTLRNDPYFKNIWGAVEQ